MQRKKKEKGNTIIFILQIWFFTALHKSKVNFQNEMFEVQ